jgi:ubiquinone/menaquinone biosynthesis C-methylase UbiE
MLRLLMGQSFNGIRMTKEQIFENLKDLIRTLSSDNIKEPKVQQLWREKQALTQEAILELSPKDKSWLEQEYQAWFEKEIKPILGSEKYHFHWI